MSNVYLKNRTSSAITVAGYTVHYMDKTDAEIVEVEGSESISGSDDASGTISAVTLPTAHSYTGVLFDSLRYYAKGTLSNTGYMYGAFGFSSGFYYATLTWEDESLGDLSDKITIADPYDRDASQTVQTVFRIIFITDTNITGYHPYDTGDQTLQSNQISAYSYNNGIHQITFWNSNSTPWYSGSYAGCIQFRYLNGVTTFNNLNAFDLVSVSEGSLSKNTTSDRYDMYNVWNNSITIHAQYSVQSQVKYNAFKYLLSSVPYWYVIDGIQTDWTDDLASIGYSEVQPVVELPTVSIDGDFGSYNWLYATNGGSVWSISANSSLDLWNSTGSGYVKVSYDSSKAYAAIRWYSDTGVSDKGENGTLSVLNNSGYIAAKNETSSSVNLYALRCAVCSSNQATVVLVYNSGNVTYNAFKLTASGTDYYYVLDGTQADWTNDLSSIGYEVKDFEEITLYMVSGQKDPQTGVTSAFTGNVRSSSCYQLYTDEQCTTPWTGYDYSNDYKVGTIPSSGVWTEFIDSVAEMPDYVGSGTDFKVGRVLLDTGFLWFCCNLPSSSSVTTSTSKIVVRIRKKDQQYYAGYFNASSTHNNSSLTYGSSYSIYNKPNTGSDNMPRINDFPDKNIVGFYGSAGNLVSSRYKNLAWRTGSPLRVTYQNLDAGTLSIRHMLYTLEEPTYYGWVNLTGNTNSSIGTVYRLRDKEGNYIPYESGVLYTVIGLFKYNGGSASGTIAYLNMSYMGKFNSSYPNDLCWMQQYGNVSVSYVWYIKKHVDTTGMAYCTNKGLNGENKSGISNASYYELYDADGNVISVDSNKQYVCTKAFLKDGTSVDNWENGAYVDPSVCYVRLDSSGGTLKFNANPLPWTNSGYECYSMSYIEL